MDPSSRPPAPKRGAGKGEWPARRFQSGSLCGATLTVAPQRAAKRIILCVGAIKAFGYPEFFAPPHHVVFRVTLRVLWPALLAAAIYVAAICFAAFDVTAVLGLTNLIFTFSTYVFRELTPTEGTPEYGGVATLSVIMLVMVVYLLSAYVPPNISTSRIPITYGGFQYVLLVAHIVTVKDVLVHVEPAGREAEPS